MSHEILSLLPSNWVGLFAGIMFFVYIGAQIIEKYEALAKFMPGGRWWHERQKQRRGRRGATVDEENHVIHGMQEQVSSIARELASVRDTLRSFTAWSVYDSRWHHQASIAAAMVGTSLPEHLDYFAFEKVWSVDPVEAARMPVSR